MGRIAFSEIDCAHDALIPEIDAAFTGEFAEMVFQNAAIDLPGRRRHHRADAEFGYAFEILAPPAPE